MRSFVLLFISFCFSYSVFGQSIVKDFNIHFSSNSSKISSNELKVLKRNFDELTNLMVAYEIEISGYADATGDAEINKELSKKRALSVTNYMIKRGVSKSQITAQYFGSSNFLTTNLTEADKAFDRRTNIKIKTKEYTPTNIAGYELKPQEYNFSCEKETKIETVSGSKFTIPEDAFVDEEGKLVEGEVKLEIVEYRDPLDFVFASEPMNLEQDGKIAFYQSDGMFKIEAKQGDKKLSLAKGKSIESEIQLKENQSESRFYAFNADSGQWNNGQSINQNTLTLGHDAQFSNSKACREAMVAFKLNLKYSLGEKISPDYAESLKKVKDEIAIKSVYKSRKKEIKVSEKLDRKVNRLEDKLKQKQHRYAFKHKETRARKTAFDLELHRKSRNKRQNEVIPLYGLRLQVARKQLKTKNRKLAFRHKTELSNVRLVKNDSAFTLTYDAMIVKKVKGEKDSITFKDSLTNIKLVNDGWIAKITGGPNKKRSFANYQKGLKKYDDLLAKIEARISDKEEDRDSVKQIVVAHNDTIESTEFLKKVETFTEFGQNNFLTTSKESQWLYDFDQNQNVMNTTIDSVLATSQYATCSFRNNNYMLEQARQDKLQKVLGNSGLGVNLASMGTYNADAIKQLKQPDLIFASYKDENGNDLAITVIYVFDQTLNGVMRFDGYMDRSPYKFEISRSNAKSLIAFDNKMNAFMIPNSEFQKLIQKKNVNFVLKPFKKAASKEDITNQMAI